MSGHSHLRRVLVEQLTVVENKLSVCCKLLAAAVPETRKERRDIQYNILRIRKIPGEPAFQHWVIENIPKSGA